MALEVQTQHSPIRLLWQIAVYRRRPNEPSPPEVLLSWHGGYR